MRNLKAYDELFLFINVEIIELVELFLENPNEPFLEVQQGGLVVKAISIGVRRKIDIWGGGVGKVALEELLEGLVAEELVPPLREGLLQVGRELLPELHD
jgi:hypothetical protein